MVIIIIKAGAEPNASIYEVFADLCLINVCTPRRVR